MKSQRHSLKTSLCASTVPCMNLPLTGLRRHIPASVLTIRLCEQVAKIHVRERREQARLDARMRRFEVAQELFHLYAFLIGISAGRTGATGDRKPRPGDKAHDVGLGDVREGPDHDVPAVIR